MQAIEHFKTSASVETIWRLLLDVEHWSSWTPTVVEIRALDDQTMKVGSRYKVVQPGLRPATYEVTTFTPNREFAWVQKLPGGGLVAEHRVADRGDFREVELSFRSQGLLATLASMLFSARIRQFVATEAQALKERCERPS